MSKTFSFNYFGASIEATPLGVVYIPSVQETVSAHCVPFTNDGEIIAVNIIGRGIDIPGGHIDDSETAFDAMQREAREEAQISVGNPVLADVWRLASTNSELGLSQKPYVLIYTADVQSIDEFIPNDEADERLILQPEEFITNYFGDAQMARIMVDRALSVRK